jgi:hypothetical protein
MTKLQVWRGISDGAIAGVFGTLISADLKWWQAIALSVGALVIALSNYEEGREVQRKIEANEREIEALRRRLDPHSTKAAP